MGTSAKEPKLPAEIQAACMGRASEDRIEAKFVSHMGAQPVARAELLGHPHGQLLVEAPLHVNPREFPQLGPRILRKLPLFNLDVRELGVALRANGYVFTCRHRHRPGDEACRACEQDNPLEAEDAATPIIRLAVETIASSAPRTAARSQPALAL